MSFLDRMLRGSFRGVEFLTTGSNTQGGRKTIVYEFPNSDRRFVEDLGKFKKQFTIDAIIQGPNYLNKRDRFLAALERPGSGLLIHPYYGTQRVSLTQLYQLREDFSHLGVAKFFLGFSVAESNIFPEDSNFGSNNVFNTSDLLHDSVVNDIANTFGFSNATNFGSSFDNVNEMLDKFEDSTRFVASNAQSNNEFISQLTNYRDRVASIISTPRNFGQSTSDLFNAVNALGNSSREKFNVSRSFFNYNEDFIKAPPKTTYQQERLFNTTLTNNTVNLFSLINGYRNIIDVDFISIEELAEFSDVLEDQYNFVIDSNYEDAKIEHNEGDFSEPTIELITLVRTQVNNSLRDLRDDLVEVVEITLRSKKSLLAFVYEQYGSLDRLTDITLLNELTNTQFIGPGQVLVFQNSSEPTL